MGGGSARAGGGASRRPARFCRGCWWVRGARVELLGEVQMAACIAYSKLEGLEALPSLFFEFHGTPAGVAEQAQQAEEIAAGYDGLGFAWATEAAGPAELGGGGGG